ncbi:MAG TPA: hypothetical protein VE643_00120 [Nitrososphaeraceae archaeon]|nr:hypothetical protein [Nitrososphaeraceae archaeon]
MTLASVMTPLAGGLYCQGMGFMVYRSKWYTICCRARRGKRRGRRIRYTKVKVTSQLQFNM